MDGNREANGPAPHPAQVQICCCTTARQGKGFSLTRGNVAAAPIDLLGLGLRNWPEAAL